MKKKMKKIMRHLGLMGWKRYIVAFVQQKKSFAKM